MFEDIDRTFGKSAVTVEVIPMCGTARNAGVKAKIFVRIGISAFVRVVSARVVADTNGIRKPFEFDGFMTDIFESDRTVFASANAMKHKRSIIFRAYRRTVDIEIVMGAAGVTGIERNTHSLEFEIIT